MGPEVGFRGIVGWEHQLNPQLRGGDLDDDVEPHDRGDGPYDLPAHSKTGQTTGEDPACSSGLAGRSRRSGSARPGSRITSVSPVSAAVWRNAARPACTTSGQFTT